VAVCRNDAVRAVDPIAAKDHGSRG
jgi:hypothetical protein